MEMEMVFGGMLRGGRFKCLERREPSSNRLARYFFWGAVFLGRSRFPVQGRRRRLSRAWSACRFSFFLQPRASGNQVADLVEAIVDFHIVSQCFFSTIGISSDIKTWLPPKTITGLRSALQCILRERWGQ